MEQWNVVGREWSIAVVAKSYNVTPRVAAAEIEDDPEHLALRLLPLYRYADAKFRYDSTQDKTRVDDYHDREMMDRVVMFEYNRRHRVAHPELVADCPDCAAMVH